MKLAPILCLALTACGANEARIATNPHASGTMLGRSIQAMILCAGQPDKVLRLGTDSGLAEWAYKDTEPAFKLGVAVVGSLELGGGSDCKMTVIFHSDGRIVGISFPQCTTSLFGGPYAGAGTLVGNCERYYREVQMPAGWDAVAALTDMSKK